MRNAFLLKMTLTGILCLLWTLGVKGQEKNLVPNFDFQTAQPNGWPACKPLLSQNNLAYHFDDNIADWRVAMKRSCEFRFYSCRYNSPDWYEVGGCGNNLEDYSAARNAGMYFPSNRIVGLAQQAYYDEAIRVQLKESLRTGRTYVFKIKMATVKEGDAYPYSKLRVHFSEYGEHWDQIGAYTKYDVKQLFVFSKKVWEGYETEFEVPSSWTDNALDNLILEIGSEDDRELYIDDVELYEKCVDEAKIQKRTYAYKDQLGSKIYSYETGQKLLAGYNVGSSFLPVGNVLVKDKALIQYKAGSNVALKPGFKVESGGKFRAFIAPCGQACPPPVANAGEDVGCVTGTITLGASGNSNYTYRWEADPSSATSYLSSTQSAQTTFTPPTTGTGAIVYRLIVTNACGETAVDEVVVGYNSTSGGTPPVFTINSTGSYIYYTPEVKLTVNSQAGKVTVELLDENENPLNPADVVTISRGNGPFKVGSNIIANIFLNGCYEPCKKFRLRVTVENICDQLTSTQTVDWYAINLTNNFRVVGQFNPDLGEKFCFHSIGATIYSVYIWDDQSLFKNRVI